MWPYTTATGTPTAPSDPGTSHAVLILLFLVLFVGIRGHVNLSRDVRKTQDLVALSPDQ